MIRRVLLGTVAVLAGSALVVRAAPKDDVTGAAKKLADSASYSWKQTTENAAGAGAGAGAGGAGGGRRGGGGRGGFGGGGPVEGKTEKGGYTVLTVGTGDFQTQVVLKGDKVAAQTQDGWQTAAEAQAAADAAGGGGRRGGRGPLAYVNYKLPAAVAEDIASKTKELKKEGDVITGDLTEEGAKSFLTLGGGGGRRGGGAGGAAPEIAGAKGTAKFWAKDGAISKVEYNVQGSMSFGGNDIAINRTTTIEISNVGSTKVEVPEEAKKKLQ